MWSIYKHTFPNGKCYIGLTKQDPKTRFKNGYGYETCPLMWNAIQKYGWDSIETTWLYTEINDLNKACYLEKEAIEQYHSNEREFGYNLANGGQGGATNKYDHGLIYQCWLEGHNIVEITRIIGCSNVTVRRVLDEYNVPSFERRSRQNKIEGKPNNKYNHEVILQQWLDGKTVKEICDEHGCNRGTVKIILDNANISLEEREKRRREASAQALRKRHSKTERSSVAELATLLDD